MRCNFLRGELAAPRTARAREAHNRRLRCTAAKLQQPAELEPAAEIVDVVDEPAQYLNQGRTHA
jgi:hypothetical protein